MSKRIHALTVALNESMLDDDVQPIIDAIKMVRGVLAVKPEESKSETFWAYEKAKSELGTKLWEVLYPKK